MKTNFLNVMSVVLLGAGDADWGGLTEAFNELIKSMFIPLIGIASTLTLLWGVFIGFKFWKSGGDEGKKKEAKGALISFVVGIIVIFAIAVGAPLLITTLVGWFK